MFTNDTHILCASGSISTPRLEIIVYAPTNERAIEAAKPVVQSLAGADYFHFELYLIAGGEGEMRPCDVSLATFTTKKAEIEVSVKTNV